MVGLIRTFLTDREILNGLAIHLIWTASSEFGTYRLCEQRRFRRACASAQSRQNLHCSLIHALSQEEHSDRKPDPWPLWMAGHAQLKLVMTECSKTQIRLTGPIWSFGTYTESPGFKKNPNVVYATNISKITNFFRTSERPYPKKIYLCEFIQCQDWFQILSSITGDILCMENAKYSARICFKSNDELRNELFNTLYIPSNAF